MQEDCNTLDGTNHPSVTLGQLGQGLAYWIELTDFAELLKGFGKTSAGLLGLKEKCQELSAVTNLFEITYKVKALKAFTVEQLRKIAQKIGLGRMKTKKDIIEKLENVVATKMLGLITDATKRKNERLKKFQSVTRILVRFIGVVFHEDYSVMYANLNNNKSRKDMESGPGAKNERFFANIAEIVNDDTSHYHRQLLSDSENSNYPCTDYDSYVSELLVHTDNSTPMDEKVEWKELKSYNNMLHKARSIMVDNMTVSGNHDSDPYTYTANAISQCSVKASLSQTVLFYFFMHMNFNVTLSESNQSTIPDSGTNRISGTN